MTRVSFEPVLRSSVGFEHLLRSVEGAKQTDSKGPSYPPYNVEQVGENKNAVTLAVAGFDVNELQIDLKGNTLTVVGRKMPEDEEMTYLHRGIAGRDFFRKFQLAEHVHVASAHLEHGLLRIEFFREMPEEEKPRHIAIRTGCTATALSSGSGRMA